MKLARTAHPECRTPGRRAAAGAAMTEALLVMFPLFVLLMVGPGIATIWIQEQYARAEAHRDMLDKTTTFLLLPDAFQSSGTNPATSSFSGLIPVSARRHAYPAFPPAIDGLSGNPNGTVDAPDPKFKSFFLGPRTVEAFPDGFPNQPVEGWKYQEFEYRGGLFRGSLELMRYASVIRSPWTWLGWPFVPTQDLLWEPKVIQDWHGDVEHVSDAMKKGLKLKD